MFVPLVTPRLALRALSAPNATAVALCRSDPEVARYQRWASEGLADAQSFIAGLAWEPDLPGTWFQLAITLRDDGQVIGDLGPHFPVDRPRQAEIGITLSPQHQRRGFATEALRAALAYLFRALQKHRDTSP